MGVVLIGKHGVSALFIAVFMFFSVAGCGDDKEGYEGVGRLVAERSRARLSQSEKKKASPVLTEPLASAPMDGKSSKKVLVEEDVHVVSSSSGRILAKGIAYLDENGKIITIRIGKQ